jgi:hypothetical protein
MAAKRKRATKHKKAAKAKAKARKMKLVYVPIDELVEWEKNPRKNDVAAEKLCGLLEEHGFVNPIIASRDKVIRAGHTRLKAAKSLGIKEVPVIYVDFDSEEQAELYAIADNKASEWAEWDKEMLSSLLNQRRKLVTPARVERLTGFTRLELEGMRTSGADFAAQDFASAVEQFEQQNPQTKTKEWWCWVILPSEAEFRKLMEKCGRKRGKKYRGRELDPSALLPKVRIPVGPRCSVCKGTGIDADRVNKRCPSCGGAGCRPVKRTKAAKRKRR